MPLPSRVEADRRYERLREIALEIAQSSIDDHFRVTKINSAALSATRLWDKSVIRKYPWDWDENYNFYRLKYPKRFEVALWETDVLVAISMGRPTYNATGLRLDVVEAMPRDLGERSSVFDKIILAYEVYARLINADHIRIMNPVNESVKSLYEHYGYRYVSKDDYLIKQVL